MHKTRPWDEFHAVKIGLHEVIMGSWVVNVADIDEDYVFLREHVGSFLKWGYRLINNLNYLNMSINHPAIGVAPFNGNPHVGVGCLCQGFSYKDYCRRLNQRKSELMKLRG